MATWEQRMSITDGGTIVIYEVETTTPDSGTGEGNRHRLKEAGTAYAPAPQGRPCRSPNYIAAVFDPFFVLDYAQTGRATSILRVTDVTGT